ncbi:MAG: hypothetical protein K6D38_03745 [Pseudobutyrivibrio sp.]|nr:hypothetical protein [Pseudobutyrivibrio sp.]
MSNSNEMISNKEMWENLITYYDDVCTLMNKKRDQCQDIYNSVLRIDDLSLKKDFFEENTRVIAKLNKVQWNLGNIIKRLSNVYPESISKNDYNLFLENIKNNTLTDIQKADEIIEEHQLKANKLIDINKPKNEISKSHSEDVIDHKQELISNLEKYRSDIENKINKKYVELKNLYWDNKCGEKPFDELSIELAEIKSLCTKDIDDAINRIKKMDASTVDKSEIDRDYIDTISAVEFSFKHDIANYDNKLAVKTNNDNKQGVKLKEKEEIVIPSYKSAYSDSYPQNSWMQRSIQVSNGQKNQQVNIQRNTGLKFK